MSLLSRIQMQDWLYTGFSCHFSMVTCNLEHYTFLIPLPTWQVQIVSCCDVHVLDFWWIVHLSISFYALPTGVSVYPQRGGCPLSLMYLYQYVRNQTWFLEKGLTSHRHPRPGSSWCPVSRSAFGQGFERAQLSDRSKDTPSFLLNSGEDECDSCWVWHFLWDLTLCQLGSVSERPPAECQRPPRLLLINGSWQPRPVCVLGGGIVRNGKPPQGAPQGCTWASTGLHLPKMDKRLTHLSPFIFQEDRKRQGSQTLRHQPGYYCQCRHHSTLSHHL